MSDNNIVGHFGSDYVSSYYIKNHRALYRAKLSMVVLLDTWILRQT